VAALDPDLEGAGTRCSLCLRAVPPRPRIGDPEDPLGSVYCSAECSDRAEAQYRRLLFAPKPALPTELESAGGADDGASEPPMAERLAAQAAFVAFLKGAARERTVPHLLARYLARQVALETAKLLQGQLGAKVGVYKADLPDVPQYTLMDHIERLRFLDISVPDEENDMMRELLRTALPGLVRAPNCAAGACSLRAGGVLDRRTTCHAQGQVHVQRYWHHATRAGR
jgi:import receptor subunit TOM20